jgi:hypothetical protein
MSKYDDIINLSRPRSKHPKLSIDSRAAQFAPFAALTGYDEQVKETARLTSNKSILDDDVIDKINNKLDYINKNINDNILVNVTYFVPDKKKSGGKYVDIKGYVTKIKIVEGYIIIDNNNIPMNNIIDIEIIK